MRRSVSACLGILVCLFFILPPAPRSALAQETGPTSRPSITVPHAKVAPLVTADPKDAAWESAAEIDGLSLSIGPQGEGLTPTPTKLQLLWDENNLYVRFTCDDQSIFAPHGKERNAMHSDGDVAEVFLDPGEDCREFFELQINPLGGVMDGRHTVSTQPSSGADGVLTRVTLKFVKFEKGWDMPGFRWAATIAQPGNGSRQFRWTADLAIPAQSVLKSLGMSQFKAMSLHANFMRYDHNDPNDGTLSQKPVFMNWSPVMWGRPHRSPAAMGTLILEP